MCEKTYPTLEGFDRNEKGECYYCYGCINFCTNEMFIDTGKIAQINRLLTTYSLDFDSISKEKYFDQIIKSIIRLLIPYKRVSALEQLDDALKGKKDMAQDAIQNIVIRLKAIFPEKAQKFNISEYNTWIKQNEPRWKEKIQPIHLDKLFYGLKRET